MLKEGFHVLLVNGEHRNAALEELAGDVIAGCILSSTQRAALLSSTTAAALTPREIIFQSSIANKITILALTNRRIEEHMFSILSYASTVYQESRIEFAAERKVDIARKLRLSDFILGASLQSCKRYARAAI